MSEDIEIMIADIPTLPEDRIVDQTETDFTARLYFRDSKGDWYQLDKKIGKHELKLIGWV